MKKLAKNALKSLGYELKRINSSINKINAPDKRPVGQMDSILEDLKMRGLNCKSVVDVGANRTSWSRIAKNIFQAADFYLIEPQIEMEEYLKSFTNEFVNSKYFLKGAGAKNEVLALTIWDDLTGSSFLPKKIAELIKNGKQREIEIIKIDDLIVNNEIKNPELIKLDIQGFELEALKGAEQTFGYTEVYILEVSLFSNVPDMPIISDVINFMFNRDYVVYDFAGFLRRPLDGALGQCDICFVKKDGFLRKSNDW